MKYFLRKIKRVILWSVKIYFYSKASKFECNICNFKCNNFFSDGWHKNSRCPYCGSEIRQRLLFASLTNLDAFNFKKIIDKKRILHFAPEDILMNKLKKRASTYKTADFLATGYFYGKIDYNIDISNMSSIGDNSFDCVIACDVLEHVKNDNAAIKEVYRILDNDGYCIFTVPQKDGLRKTYEDNSLETPEEKKKNFGQEDHFRIYGQDFKNRLSVNGFKVFTIDEHSFNKEEIKRNILAPQKYSKNPLATNFRKIYFGKK